MIRCKRKPLHWLLYFFIFIVILCVFNWTTTKIVARDFLYVVRPVWDSKPKPWNVLHHYFANDLNASELCELHNWTARTSDIKVIDAVIFSIELDLLEIRLKELWPFVDQFIILEADKTFTGRSKPLHLRDNLERFSWAKEKLIYQSYDGLTELQSDESPFKNENNMRSYMTSIINQYARNGDSIICSDVDEIPSKQTIQLIKQCDGAPDNLHLELKTYMYSFEFFFSADDSWRAHISKYDSGFGYKHGRLSDDLLADSGWHCTFCFRYLSDFIFKMTSYSHNDRVMHKKMLEKEQIQRKICAGDNVFDMYPEVYTFKEMFIKFGSIPKSKAMTNLPDYLIQHAKQFAFLLPNGCVRDDFNSTLTTTN